MNRSCIAVLALAGLLGPIAANAALELNTQPTRAARPHAQAPSTERAEASKIMRDGVITGLDVAGQRVQIHGKWHLMVTGQTMVYQQGKLAGVYVLKVGQTLKFTLNSERSDVLALGAVYVP